MAPLMTSDFLLVAFVPLFFVFAGIEWAFKMYQRHGEDLEA